MSKPATAGGPRPTCTSRLIDITRGWLGSHDEGTRQEATALVRVLEHFLKYGEAHFFHPPPQLGLPTHYSQGTLQLFNPIFNHSEHYPFSTANVRNVVSHSEPVLGGTLLDSRYAPPRPVDPAIAEPEFVRAAERRGIKIQKPTGIIPVANQAPNGIRGTAPMASRANAESSAIPSENPGSSIDHQIKPSYEPIAQIPQLSGLVRSPGNVNHRVQSLNANAEAPLTPLNPKAREFNIQGRAKSIVEEVRDIRAESNPSVQPPFMSQQATPGSEARLLDASSLTVEQHMPAWNVSNSQTVLPIAPGSHLSLLTQLEGLVNSTTANGNAVTSPMLSPIPSTVERGDHAAPFSEPLVPIKMEDNDLTNIYVPPLAYTGDLDVMIFQSVDEQQAGPVGSVATDTNEARTEDQVVDLKSTGPQFGGGLMEKSKREEQKDIAESGVQQQMGNRSVNIKYRRLKSDLLKLAALAKENSIGLTAKENEVLSLVGDNSSPLQGVNDSDSSVNTFHSNFQFSNIQPPTVDFYRCTVRGGTPKPFGPRPITQGTNPSIAQMTLSEPNTSRMPTGTKILGQLLSHEERLTVFRMDGPKETTLGEGVIKAFRRRRVFEFDEFIMFVGTQSGGILVGNLFKPDLEETAKMQLKISYLPNYQIFVQISGTIKDLGPNTTLHVMPDGNPLVGRRYQVGFKLPDSIFPNESVFKTVMDPYEIPEHIQALSEEHDIVLNDLRHLSLELQTIYCNGFKEGTQIPAWEDISSSGFSHNAQLFFVALKSIREGSGNLKLWFLHPGGNMDRLMEEMSNAHKHNIETWMDHGLMWCSKLVNGRVIWHL